MFKKLYIKKLNNFFANIMGQSSCLHLFYVDKERNCCRKKRPTVGLQQFTVVTTCEGKVYVFIPLFSVILV
jgi:hypothetical protein